MKRMPVVVIIKGKGKERELGGQTLITSFTQTVCEMKDTCMCVICSIQ